MFDDQFTPSVSHFTVAGVEVILSVHLGQSLGQNFGHVEEILEKEHELIGIECWAWFERIPASFLACNKIS